MTKMSRPRGRRRAPRRRDPALSALIWFTTVALIALAIIVAANHGAALLSS